MNKSNWISGVLCATLIGSMLSQSISAYECLFSSADQDCLNASVHLLNSVGDTGISHCTDGDYVYLETETTRFDPDDNVVVSFLANSQEDIASFTYTQSGFTVLSASIDADNTQTVEKR